METTDDIYVEPPQQNFPPTPSSTTAVPPRDPSISSRPKSPSRSTSFFAQPGTLAGMFSMIIMIFIAHFLPSNFQFSSLLPIPSPRFSLLLGSFHLRCSSLCTRGAISIYNPFPLCTMSRPLGATKMESRLKIKHYENRKKNVKSQHSLANAISRFLSGFYPFYHNWNFSGKMCRTFLSHYFGRIIHCFPTALLSRV